jgi:hypothetical protein
MWVAEYVYSVLSVVEVGGVVVVDDDWEVVLEATAVFDSSVDEMEEELDEAEVTVELVVVHPPVYSQACKSVSGV